MTEWQSNKATPRPWRDHGGEVVGDVGSDVETVIAVDIGDLPDDVAKANTALIVKAVNERGELIAALRAITDHYVTLINSGDYGFWNPEEEAEVIAARAALAKAESVS